MFCKNCGKELNEDAKFCPDCGTAAEIVEETAAPEAGASASATENTAPQSDFTAKVGEFFKSEDKSEEYDPADIANNKVFGILAYIGILVLVPIFGAPRSKFARFHANQGLNLCILEVAYAILSAVILGILKIFTIGTFNIMGGMIYLAVSSLLGILSLGFVAYMVLGIIFSAQGKAKELPLLSKIKLLK